MEPAEGRWSTSRWHNAITGHWLCSIIVYVKYTCYFSHRWFICVYFRNCLGLTLACSALFAWKSWHRWDEIPGRQPLSWNVNIVSDNSSKIRRNSHRMARLTKPHCKSNQFRGLILVSTLLPTAFWDFVSYGSGFWPGPRKQGYC